MVERHNIGILEIGPEATVGTVASAFKYLRSLPVSMSSLSEEPLKDDYQRQGDYSVALIGGNRRGTLVTRHYLTSYSGTIPSAAPALLGARNASATLWDVWMAVFGLSLGHAKAGGYVAATVAGSNNRVTVDDAGTGIGSFVAGQGLVIPVTGGGYEVGWAKTPDTLPTPDEIDLLLPPLLAPSGSALWGTYTFGRGRLPLTPYLDYTEAAAALSLRYTGYGGDQYTMYGCWPQNIKVTAAVGRYLEVEVTWAVAHWEEATDSAPTVQSWAYPVPQRIRNWDVRIGDTSSATQIRTSSIEIDWGLSLQPQEGGHSESGIEGWYYEMRQPTVSMQVYRRELAEVALYTAQTAKTLQVSFGTQPGQMVGFCLPAARLDGYPGRAEANGAVKADLVFRPDFYDGDAGNMANDAVIDTDFRVCFG